VKALLAHDNPFGPSRYGYLFGVLSAADPGRHLDYGCFDGLVVRQLMSAGVISQGVGVDLNSDAIATAVGTESTAEFHLLDRTRELLTDIVDPKSVDSASLLDVIEHVADQHGLLVDVRSVVKEGGILVVTVPKQHLFSVLDGGNFKFRFPRTHRWLYLRNHSEANYLYRYVDNPDGLVGDVEKAKSWHQHFSADELSTLLAEAGFDVIDVDGAGLFHRPLVYLRRLRLPVSRLIEWDMRRFSSCHLFVTARAR